MAKFVGIPALTQGLTPWQKIFMDATKENLELLCSQRGDGSKSAVLKGDITVDYLPAATGPTLAEVNAVISQLNLLLSVLKN